VEQSKKAKEWHEGVQAYTLCPLFMPRSSAAAFQFGSKHPFLSNASKNFAWLSSDISLTSLKTSLKIVWFDLRFGVSTVEVCEIESITGLRRAGSANEK
jgi:hypothetical protein